MASPAHGHEFEQIHEIEIVKDREALVLQFMGVNMSQTRLGHSNNDNTKLAHGL